MSDSRVLHTDVYDYLNPDKKDDDVEKKVRNNFAFNDLKKSKKAYKKRNDLDHSFFHTSNLDNVNFEKSNLEDSTFFNTALLDANLKGANLKNSKFEFGIVDGANFEGANLEGVTFKGVERLDRANFKNTIYEGKKGFGENYTGKSLLGEVNDKRKEYLKEQRLIKKATATASALDGTAKGVTKRRHRRSHKKRKHRVTKRRK